MTSPNRTPLFTVPALSLCAALFVTFTANAGPPDKNPVTEVLTRPFNWTGFYLGLNIGGVLSDYEFDGNGLNNEILTDVDVAQQFFQVFPGNTLAASGVATLFGSENGHEDRRGSVLGGGQVGYNFQFGHFVVGVEGEFDRTSERGFTTIKDDASTDIFLGGSTTIRGLTSFTGVRKAESNWNASARLRFGYSVGALLLYGTGGVAFADVHVCAEDIASTNFFSVATNDGLTPTFLGSNTNTNLSRDSDVLVGWTAGGGIEVALGDAVTFGLEYRHNGFGDETYGFNSHGGPIFPDNVHVDLDSDQVTVRMNILLNHILGHGDGLSTGLVQGSSKDKNVAVAPMVEEFSWSGPYIGAHVGGVWTDYDFHDSEAVVDVGSQVNQLDLGAPTSGSVLVPFTSSSLNCDSEDSILGGGQLGYQFQFGHFVAGVEADFSGMSFGASTVFASTNTGEVLGGEEDVITTLRSTRSAQEKWQGSARARLGWAPGQGRILFYATGGGAWAGVSTVSQTQVSSDFFSGNLDGNVTGSTGRSNDDVVFGWTAGAGAEWAFNNVFSVGMEYRHNEFDSADFPGRAQQAIFTSGSHVDLDSDQVTFKVNVLLGTFFRRN